MQPTSASLCTCATNEPHQPSLHTEKNTIGEVGINESIQRKHNTMAEAVPVPMEVDEQRPVDEDAKKEKGFEGEETGGSAGAGLAKRKGLGDGEVAAVE